MSVPACLRTWAVRAKERLLHRSISSRINIQVTHKCVPKMNQQSVVNSTTRYCSTATQYAAYDVIQKTGRVFPERDVPNHIEKPAYVDGGLFGLKGMFQKAPSKPDIKNKKQIKGMRDACKVARDILQRASELVAPGVTTDDIDILVHEGCVSNGAYPSPLNYKGFPKAVCTSVNNVACHGIPDSRQLRDGDIINIDVTVFYKGFHGDLSQTFLVGSVDHSGRHLVECARRCRDEAIAICGPGVPFFGIGHMVQYIAEEEGFDVIPNFCGHGIGEYFHGPPEIYHFANDIPGEMAEGMTFTVEPIITEGDPGIEILDDGWTATSRDGSRSAQFEHTILITDSGCQILTL